MTRAGVAGVCRRKFVITTLKDGGRQAPDLVERNFTAEVPDRLWVFAGRDGRMALPGAEPKNVSKREGQHAVRSDSLIPNAQLSTKPG
jgi:hypothetical protein